MQMLVVAGLALAGWWVIQLAQALRRPASWEAGRGGVMPFRVTRRAYVAICIVGIVAGLAVFAIGWSARSA